MEDILLNIGGKEFYFDIDNLAEQVQYHNNDNHETPQSKDDEDLDSFSPLKIDVTKYEMYRDLVGTILTYTDGVDDKLGMVGLNQLPIPFKS